MNPRLRTLTCLCASVLPAAPSAGALHLWISDTGGVYHDPANWDLVAVPGAGDTALFDLGTSYAVQTGAAASLGLLVVDSDDVDLALGATFTAAGLALGDGAGNHGALRVTGGTLAVPSGTALVRIGKDPDSVGDLVISGGATFSSMQQVLIGDGGDGSMIVEPGASAVCSGLVQLGDDPGAVGLAEVQGPGATWSAGGEMFIGNNGSATVTVSGGGTLQTARAKIGDEIGSSGLVTVTGAGSTWSDSIEIFVGNFGGGTLMVGGGASVTGVAGTIADDPGSVGAATVSGAGSTWTSTAALRVGDLGSGTLAVSAGGAVGANGVTLGFGAGSMGTAIVTGAGSSLNSSGSIQVGAAGSGLLRVVDGGHVVTQGSYVQSAAGDLEIVLGPASAGMVAASGSASLGGDLTVTLAPGFVPPPGYSVDIITAAPVLGNFSSTSLPAGMEMAVLADRVALTLEQADVPGDVTGDGVVDVSDLTGVILAWGVCSSPPCAADLSGDGLIDVQDLTTVILNWS